MLFNKLKILLNPQVNTSCKTLRRLMCIKTHPNETLFSTMLDMNSREAASYVHSNNLDHIDSYRISETLKFLKEYNFKKSDILKYGSLFAHCTKLNWKQPYFYLLESGVELSIENLLKYTIIRTKTIASLKRHGFVPKDMDVIKEKLKYLTPKNIEIDTNGLYEETITLNEIHGVILEKFLMKRLETTEPIIKNMFRVHKDLSTKSYQLVCENLDIALELGITKERIVRNAYILEVLPEHTRDLIKNVPEFAGVDIKHYLKTIPSLIGICSQRFKRICDIFNKEHIPEEILGKRMQIFTLSPSTIASRIEEIKHNPEMRILWNSPKIVNLIVNFNIAMKRFAYLQESKLKCTSIRVIANQSEAFDFHIKEGVDIVRGYDVHVIIQNLLKSNDPMIRERLQKHPLYLHVPLSTVEQTFFYLKRVGFQEKHFIQQPTILFYPKEKIKIALPKLNAFKALSSKKHWSRVLELNILLYFLEKDYYFTGDGIWKNNIKMIESE